MTREGLLKGFPRVRISSTAAKPVTALVSTCLNFSAPPPPLSIHPFPNKPLFPNRL
ncbi:hypothetical protein BaRGS_00032836, partial [Batillaria attramentaria]